MQINLSLSKPGLKDAFYQIEIRENVLNFFITSKWLFRFDYEPTTINN